MTLINKVKGKSINCSDNYNKMAIIQNAVA